jgi:hypothetical protein
MNRLKLLPEYFEVRKEIKSQQDPRWITFYDKWVDAIIPEKNPEPNPIIKKI